MNIQEFIDSIENEIPTIKSGSLQASSIFREVAGWDSLASLMFLSMLDTDFHVDVSPHELKDCLTIQDLFNFIESKRTN